MDFQKSVFNSKLPHSFKINFDLQKGISAQKNTTKRTLSELAGIYYDSNAFSELLSHGNPLVYEFYELGLPEDKGEIAFGTSIVYPGKVGNEYFMTKGHYHSVLNTAEVYLCLSGKGVMLMQSLEGEWNFEEFEPGAAVYCPKGFAHRSINTGKEPLVTFFSFRADAGHDYKTIKSNGFRKLVLEENNKAIFIDNPNWKCDVI